MKEWLDHPWLRFTQRRHRKINCTNWVTEFIKLVFSFSTFIRHSLCESIPEVTLSVPQLRREERRQHCQWDQTSAAKTLTNPLFTALLKLFVAKKKKKKENCTSVRTSSKSFNFFFSHLKEWFTIHSHTLTHTNEHTVQTRRHYYYK